MLKVFGKKSKLDEEIEAVCEALKDTRCDDEKYDVYLSKLDTLYSLKAKKAESGIKVDTVAMIAANLLGIALILGYEQAHVITTKAIGFVAKGRV